MPQRHRYKCLNPNCPSMTRSTRPLTFSAMNSPMPCCPQCGGRRLEDWGEDINVMGGASDNTKNSDNNFRRIADQYGLTDMNNKDGQAVKRHKPAPAAKSNEPTVKVGGIDVPMSLAGSAGCANIPGMAQSLKAQIGAGSPSNSPMMKQMTRVAAEHKGAA